MTLPQENREGPARGALCAGLFSSGSTWAFNIVARLLRLAHPIGHVATLYLDDLSAAASPTLRDADCVVLKTHAPSAIAHLLARMAGFPALLSVRDPRDAIVSLMQRFGLEFDPTLAQVTASSAALLPFAGQPDVLLLRYEDGFAGRHESVDAIACHLRIPLEQAEKDALFAALTPDAVTLTIAELQARQVFANQPPAKTWDPETHWHPSHIGNGRIGKWREVLTDAEAARVFQATRKFCAAFGYPGGPALAHGTELEFSCHGTGAYYLGEGFSEVEPWGVWTDGETSVLRLPLQAPAGDVLHLELLCRIEHTALSTDLPEGSIRVLVNGSQTMLLRASAHHPAQLLLVLRLENAALTGSEEIELRLEARSLPSPADCGLSTETRRLGIGLIQLRLG